MNIIRNKRGNEMVEASIALPVIILTTMLLLRLFTFYLEILNTGVKSHEKALKAGDSYNGSIFKIYKKVDNVKMFKTGILKFDLDKKFETKLYIYNEDAIVRAGELIEK